MSQTRRSLIMQLLGLCAVFQTRKSFADCYTCNDFSTTGSGYQSSPNGIDCSTKDCINTGPLRISYLDSPHPGLFTRQEQFGLVVTEVLPGSPADRAGIAPQDHILLLNGKNPTLHSCAVHQWASKVNPRVADLVVAREGEQRSVRLRLVPIRELLSLGWIGTESHFVAASLRSGYDVEDNPYWLGLRWKQGFRSLVITNILAGSPAHKAGLALGEKITAINGTPVWRADSRMLATLVPTESPIRVRLTVATDGSERQVELTSEGVSYVLHGMARAIGQEKSKDQQLATIF